MKKRILLMAFAAALLLGGCRKQEPTPQPQPEQPPEKPPVESTDAPADGVLRIDELCIELSRGNSSTEELTSVVRSLPGWLEERFAQAENLEIGRIRISVGTAPATTAQSLTEGNVDLAFLPAGDFISYGGAATALYADATLQSDSLQDGSRGLICAAPTEYGVQLAGRAGGGKPLSWREVSRARWGVLGETSLVSYQALDLWLYSQYEERITELPRMTVYETETELFQAVAAGEVDAVVIRDDVRKELAEFWVHPAGEGDEGGGFGRPESIWDEVPVLDVTDRLYATILAAAPKQEITDERFTTALEQVLGQMMNEKAEVLPMLGAERFNKVDTQVLNATARLAALQE